MVLIPAEPNGSVIWRSGVAKPCCLPIAPAVAGRAMSGDSVGGISHPSWPLARGGCASSDEAKAPVTASASEEEGDVAAAVPPTVLTMGGCRRGGRQAPGGGWREDWVMGKERGSK